MTATAMVTGHPSPDVGAVPTRGVPGTVSVAGYRVHPMLVPLPILCMAGALATDLAAWTTREPGWSRASSWLLGTGIAAGLLAGTLGSLDYRNAGREHDHGSSGRVHIYGNSLALLLAAANLLLRREAPETAPTSATLALSVLTAAVLGVTGWAGSELAHSELADAGGWRGDARMRHVG